MLSGEFLGTSEAIGFLGVSHVTFYKYVGKRIKQYGGGRGKPAFYKKLDLEALKAQLEEEKYLEKS